MSWFEWLGEAFNPGGTGSVTIHHGPRPIGSALGVITRFLISAAVLGALFYYAPVELHILAGATAAYLLIAYLITPEPDYENMGWLGGLVDDPLRVSDDLNRYMLFLKIFLWPGQFVARALVNIFILFFRLFR